MTQLFESIYEQLNNYANTVSERDRQDARNFGLL